MTNAPQVDVQALIKLGFAGTRSLAEILDASLRLQDLRELARSRGWRLQGTSKQAVIEQIIAYHQADADWAVQLRRLPAGMRVMFQYMWVAGMVERRMQYGMSQMLGQHTGFVRESYFQEIGKAGLSVQSFIRHEDQLFLWPDAYRVLPLDATWLAPLTETGRLRSLPTADPMRLALAAHALPDYLAQNDVATPSDEALQWTAPSTTVSVVSSRRSADVIIQPQSPLVPLSTLTRLADGLGLQKLEAHLLLLAMAGLGYITRSTQGRILADAQSIDKLRDIELPDLARRLVQYLITSPLWSTTDSLFPPPSLLAASQAYSPGSLFVQENILGRQAVARALLLLEAGVWYSLAGLLKRFQELRSFITYAQSVLSLSYMTEDGRRLDPSKDTGWRIAHERIYTYLLTGPFYLMGLVDLAQDDGQVSAFRLTPFCRYFLGLAARPEQAVDAGSIGRISFDTATFFTVRSASPALHVLLAKLAAPGRGRSGQSGYLISSSRLQDSLAQGEDIENLLNSVRQVCDGPLRNDTVALLRDAAASFGRYHAHTKLTLIEFGDDLALPELLRSTDLALYLRRQFSPRLIAIESRHADELFQRLVRQGYTPTHFTPDEPAA